MYATLHTLSALLVSILLCYSQRAVATDAKSCFGNPFPGPSWGFHCFDRIHCLDSSMSVCNDFFGPKCPDRSDLDARLCTRESSGRFSCCHEGQDIDFTRICDGVCDCTTTCDDEDVCKGKVMDDCPMSGAVIAGIVIGIVVALVIVVALSIFAYQRIKHRPIHQPPSAAAPSAGAPSAGGIQGQPIKWSSPTAPMVATTPQYPQQQMQQQYPPQQMQQQYPPQQMQQQYPPQQMQQPYPKY